MSTPVHTKPSIPSSFAEALRSLADQVERNEELEAKLLALRDNDIPQVMLSEHFYKAFKISPSTLTEWARHPSFPHLNRHRQKGEKIMALRDEVYLWLKHRGDQG